MEHNDRKSPHDKINMIQKGLVIRILWGLIGAIAMLIVSISIIINNSGDWVGALVFALLAPIAAFSIFYLVE